MVYSNKIDILVKEGGCAEALIALHAGVALEKATEKSENYGKLEKTKIKATPKSMKVAIVCLSVFTILCLSGAAIFARLYHTQGTTFKPKPRCEFGPRLLILDLSRNSESRPCLQEKMSGEIKDSDEQEPQIRAEEKAIKMTREEVVDLRKWSVEEKEKGNPHAESAPSAPASRDHRRPFSPPRRRFYLKGSKNGGKGVGLSRHAPRFPKGMRDHLKNLKIRRLATRF